MPGPPPKPADQRVGRHKTIKSDTIKLPSEGRKGAAPKWPYSDKPPKRWSELWSMPQAVMWERMNAEAVVARYVRVSQAAEREMTAALLAQVTQLEDRLGLTPMALLRLRWDIAADELAEVRDAKPVEPAERKPRRALKVV